MRARAEFEVEMHVQAILTVGAIMKMSANNLLILSILARF